MSLKVKGLLKLVRVISIVCQPLLHGLMDGSQIHKVIEFTPDRLQGKAGLVHDLSDKGDDRYKR